MYQAPARALIVSVKTFLALLLAAAGIALAPSPAIADTSSTARILIVGDSVTQGKVGDHTWRYRLWNTLAAEKKSVDFVGPMTGEWDVTTSNVDAPGYADPNFDQDHASRWGLMQSFLANTFDISSLMASEAPSVVVNELGINDLDYGVTPATLIAEMTQFVSDVRAVNPHVSVVFGQLTQAWATTTVDEYNAALLDLATSLDQSDARVIIATRPADYTAADTYDNLHPNAGGEVKIAGEFADALAQLPLPNIPPPAPPTPPTYSGAAHVAGLAGRHAVRLTFTTPTRATRQAVWKRDVTAGGQWRLVAYVAPNTHAYRAGSLRRHHRYAFQLRAYSGTLMSTGYSNRVALRTR